MELKRFVLLNDNRVVEIYKKEKFGYSYVDEVIYDIVCTRSILMSDVKKTSDNILDLVEPCKLWNLNGDLYEYAIDDFVFIEKVYDDTNFSTKEVKAIYKRQTNGDYKRYEIGGKE